jgi:hypothetical protein
MPVCNKTSKLKILFFIKVVEYAVPGKLSKIAGMTVFCSICDTYKQENLLLNSQ